MQRLRLAVKSFAIDSRYFYRIVDSENRGRRPGGSPGPDRDGHLKKKGAASTAAP